MSDKDAKIVLLRAENEGLREQIASLENDLSRETSFLAEMRTQRDALRAALATAADDARAQLVIAGCLTCRGGAEYKAMLANLTATQERCTSLLEEKRHEQLVSAQLSRLVTSRNRELGRALVDRDEAVAQRDAFGQKAHQLQEQVHALEAAAGGILLPGWTCPACGAFCGEAKERLSACRACGLARR